MSLPAVTCKHGWHGEDSLSSHIDEILQWEAWRICDPISFLISGMINRLAYRKDKNRYP